MTSHSKPYKVITIDKHTNKISLPNIILETRSEEVIGKISDYENFNFSFVAVGIDEVSFDVHKYVNGKKCSVWDKLVDHKIIKLQGYGRFEIKVGYADELKTIKTVLGKSLETELGQLLLKEFHANDEEDADMQYTEYSSYKYDSEGNFIPVVFYNKDNPKRSLLHMALADKAPHWSIGHVPTYVTISEDDEAELSSKFQRTYTEDGTSIYDFLTGTVAKETNVVFIFNTTSRIIDCYNLTDCYITRNGERVLTDTNDSDKIGEDTLIFATKKNIVNNVNIESNEDQIKNCFFIEAGDDTIDGMVAAVNMNGTRYIWQIPSHQLEDMSEELREKLKYYQTELCGQDDKDTYYGNGDFDEFLNEKLTLYVTTRDEAELVLSICDSKYIDTKDITYSIIDDDYNTPYWYIGNGSLYMTSTQRIPYKDVETTYNSMGIYPRLCLAYQELYQKESTLMPTLQSVDVGTAEEQYNKIVSDLTSSDTSVYVSNINNFNSTYYLGVTKGVVAYAEVLLDSRYTLKVVSDTASYDDSTYEWTGKIQITQNTDDTNIYPVNVESSDYITVKIGNGSSDDEDEQIAYTKQKLLKSLASSDMSNLDFNLDDSDKEIKDYFRQFSLNRLKSFYEGYNGCLSVLSEYGTNTASDVQKELYDKYYRITILLSNKKTNEDGILIDGNGVLDEREREVEAIKTEIKHIKKEQLEFQQKHDLYTILGDDLYNELCRYRREDTYSNSNYISDGKDSVSEQLEVAKELVDVANAELSKACMLQRTVSASLGNLLILPEFEQLYDSFALFNYIRIKTDDEILKLRLIGIEFTGDSVQDINVTFSEQVESIDRKISDLESILNSAQSMITTFPSTQLQAKKGEKANNNYIDLTANGLNATEVMVSNNKDNEVTITKSGLIAKRMDDEGYYGDKQLLINGSGMYLSEDGMKSLKMAVGEIIYTNPITGDTEKAYGLIGQTVIGNLIAGKQMHIGNENGSVLITGDGIDISNGSLYLANSEYSIEIDPNHQNENTEDGYLFCIRNLEDDSKVMSINTDGDAYYNGELITAKGKIGNWTIGNAIYNETDSSTSTKIGTYIGTDAIRLYASDDTYIHMQNGVLSCKGANIYGTFYAIAGQIGGCSIVDNVLKIGNVNIGEKLTADSIDATNLKVQAANVTGILTASQIESGTIVAGSVAAENITGTTILGKTISGGTIEGANVNAVDFTAYNDISMQYKYGNTYGEKIKVFIMGTDTSPATLQIGESIGKLGMMKVYPDTEFYNDAIVNKDLYVNGTQYFSNLTISGHSISSSDNSLTLQNLYGTCMFIRYDGSDYLRPTSDNKSISNLGSSGIPWENIYSSDGTVSSSDRNLKHNINDISETYEKLFMLLKPCSYIFNNKVRIHIGFISQDVEDSIKDVGLDNKDFAGFCKDKKTVEIVDENGNVNVDFVYDENGENEYIYSLRYSEFIALNTHMIQKTRKENEELKQQLQNQKQEIDSLKETVSILLQKIEGEN